MDFTRYNDGMSPQATPEQYHQKIKDVAKNARDAYDETLATFLFFGLIWASYERPYYKVWPDFLEAFGGTDLSKVTLADIRMPYPAIDIWFPRSVDIRMHSSQRVTGLRMVTFSPQVYEHLAKTALRPQEARVLAELVDSAPRRLMYILCVSIEPPGGLDPQGGHCELFASQFRIEDNPQQTVEEAILLIEKDMEEERKARRRRPQSQLDELMQGDIEIIQKDAEIHRQLWRIALSTCFMAIHESRYVDPDVLNKSFPQYLEAINRQDDAAIQRLTEKAYRNRHTRGWTVGRRHEIIIGKKQSASDSPDGERQKREISYGYTRPAHWQAYWVGKGRTERIVKFKLPVRVRPDLPVRADATHGYILKAH